MSPFQNMVSKTAHNLPGPLLHNTFTEPQFQARLSYLDQLYQFRKQHGNPPVAKRPKRPTRP